jgi:hypothetical protein
MSHLHPTRVSVLLLRIPSPPAGTGGVYTGTTETKVNGVPVFSKQLSGTF